MGPNAQPTGATRPQCPPPVRAPRPAQLLLAATALSAARQPAVIFEKEAGNAPPGWLAQCRLSSKSLREDPRLWAAFFKAVVSYSLETGQLDDYKHHGL